VKEIKAAAEDFRPLVLGGDAVTSAELRRALTAGGDAHAVRDLEGRAPTQYDLEGAALLVYAIRGEPSAADEEAVRLADRKSVDAVALVVEASRGEPIELPHVLATAVVTVGPGRPLPLDEIGAQIAEHADENGPALAAKLPVLRRTVCESLVQRFSRQNGVLGVAVFIPGADLPVLTLNQIRMVLRIAAAYGEEIDRERAFELLAVVGAGLGFRALARQALAFVPGPGWALKGAIAYAGTRALGEAAGRYFEAGGQERLRRARESVRRRS
jgi:uncharacterized protein (DUF697 family)